MKKLLFALFYSSGLTGIISWFNRKRVTILCYHGVTMQAELLPDDVNKQQLPQQIFRQQLCHLRDFYRVISLEEYLSMRREGRQAPPHSVVLTFDDGMRNFLTVAAPLLEEFSFPATNFIVTNLTSSMIEKYSAEWTPEDDYRYLSWTEVKELMRVPGLSFGSHTCSHPRLTDVTLTEVETELSDSQKEITEQLGHSTLALAYPFNQTSEAISRMTESLGYACGLTADLGQNSADGDLFALRRTVIAADDDLATFAARLSGMTWWFDMLRFRFYRLFKGEQAAREAYTYSPIKELDYE